MNIFSGFITSRIVATVSALAVIAIGCAAGVWQLNRAEQKIQLGNSLAAKQQMSVLNANSSHLTSEDAKERRIVARGSFLPDEAIWLDNRPRPVPEGGQGNAAQSGFFVMMPLKLDGQKTILWVNRGWAPRNSFNRIDLPAIHTDSQVIEIEGIAFAHPGKVFELGQKGSSNVRPRIEQNFDLLAEAKNHQREQLPFIVREIDPNKKDGLVREWPLPTNGVDRHYAYAFQWFALALCGFLFWLVSGFIGYRRLRKNFGG
ncbi:SURF1 family protein [Polynucleobacter brandtiae]|uniref:SURF1-like protein n=1 Tax=Polynucleobacter brandtiae TaxID=1938816 RepID=A0A2M8VQE5_9BURK|nr:SURF1 family protein [Polynucleobacter brandtiae]PJI79388.1 cytochrome oxidase assembly protein ShyY1 [Polynucleobacter brandtiae]